MSTTRQTALLLALLAALPVTAVAQTHTVTVRSDFAPDRVTPRAGTITLQNGTSQTFTAPSTVFLNKDFVELDGPGDLNGPDAQIAYFRARIDGYTIDGQDVQGAPSSFVATITQNMTVAWQWKLDYAVLVESATSGFSPPGGQTAGAATGDPSPAVGRIWAEADSDFVAEIDRSVVDDAVDAAGFRFRSSGYQLENAPAPPKSVPGDDFYWEMTEFDTQFSFNAEAFAPNNGATVAWWGKVDRRLNNERDQVFFSFNLKLIGSTRDPFTPNLPEFGNEKRNRASMDFGIRPDGQLFVEEFVPTAPDPTDTSPNPPSIYRELVSIPSALVGFDWHHWAVVFDFPTDNSRREIRVYRDAQLVLSKTLPLPQGASLSSLHARPGIISGLYEEVSVGNGEYRQPNGLFSGEDFEGGLNNLLVVPGAYTQSQVLDHASDNVIVGTPFFTDDFERDVGDVGAPLDGITRVPFPDDARSALRIDKSVSNPDEVGDRVATEPVTINSWLRVKWQWLGEVRYRISAIDQNNRFLRSQPFLGVFQEGSSTLLDTTITAEEINLPGGLTVLDHWVPVGRKVDVGAFYRSADNCLTLDDFVSAPSGDLAGFGRNVENFTDRLEANRALRFTTVTSSAAPTIVDWIYEPTVFRAEIPLGSSLDAASPDLQLVPDLCLDANLQLGSAGPGADGIPVREDPGSGTTPPLAWDQVAARLFPTRPGTYEVQWPDADPDKPSYRIEIVSGYPGSTVPLRSHRELDSGLREGFATQSYVSQVTHPGVSSDFPAAPGAHYRHLLHPTSTKTPPTQLDRDPVDHWSFDSITFADSRVNARITEGDPTAPFNTSVPGRSVLLFTQRPDPDEIATGARDQETLAVRVVRSELLSPLARTSPRHVLGQRGLSLGDDTVGIRFNSQFSLFRFEPGDRFTVDFWLNAKQVDPSSPPLRVVSFGSDFHLTLDPATATLTADYFGLQVVQPFPRAGSAWRHIVLDVTQPAIFLPGLVHLELFVDGVPERAARRRTDFNPSDFQLSVQVSNTVSPGTNITFGDGARPRDLIQLDHFRVFQLPAATTALGAAEIRGLRSQRNTTVFNNLQVGDDPPVDVPPVFWFDFESVVEPSSGGVFVPNLGTLSSSFVGALPSDTRSFTTPQEVATRIDSPLDNAGFSGSGWIVNPVSNYNAKLYTRDPALIGTWGPVFPVNFSDRFTATQNLLHVAYYENPYLVDPGTNPNVAWPYVAAAYNNVTFPAVGPHARKAIYIASRIGSEGVDQDGRPQQVFDLATYANFQVYNQPSEASAGYNPNEEHALAAASNRAALKIRNLDEVSTNNPPLAAFALQRDINRLAAVGEPIATSEPWVLVQADNLETGEPEMAAYQVFLRRTGTLTFPRPSDNEIASIAGLDYAPAPVPEDRTLTVDPDGTFNFAYTFNYPVFAGDLLIPPYPLNLVVGNIAMPDNWGGNLGKQRTLWRDVSGNAWVVSGGGLPSASNIDDGKFFHQFFYPFRSDFFMKSDDPVQPGTPIAWLPDNFGATNGFLGDGIHNDPKSTSGFGQPVKVRYAARYRSDYPKLKRGETLTYQGGEFFNETPGADGLPALVAMAAAEVVFDSATPNMVLRDADLPNYSARILRPLDRHEAPFTIAQMAAAGFSPASEKISVVAERWYFKPLSGSLGRRFYFDSLQERLVFRGRLNGKESGDPDLTAGPDPINILEPNILTTTELASLNKLSEATGWRSAITSIHALSQNPDQVRSSVDTVITSKYLPGITESSARTEEFGLRTEDAGLAELLNLKKITQEELDKRHTIITGRITELVSDTSQFAHLDSFGTGAALVPGPQLLTSPARSEFITIAENNRTELDGAPVSLHIIEIIPDRFRGAVAVVEPPDAFSEKITLQHNGDFAANTNNLHYEWWIRDAAPLDVVAKEINADGTLKEVGANGETLWQEYIPQDRAQLPAAEQHLGMHQVVFEGRPDVVLADKLVLVRYRHKTESGFNLVGFGAPSSAWKPGLTSAVDAPFQWAGAANSPQLAADGSKRYIPQLVMGWVKRVLDRINPYEARYTDFFSHESPALYSSQIQVAGAPFAGAVALNPDKNVIENVGLIELYETVLARARSLSIDNSSNAVSTDGINQAILLAATRLATLYELLAREAYSDAQDATITVTDDDIDRLEGVTAFTHSFQGLESSLLHEELALLRGTDFRKSFPVFNRMFWNYTKGLGEAAYNVNYNIYDEDTDGFINEDDARALYPQGHGDAWGYFLSALDMHYALLQHPVFNWRSRPELYSLMQNVLEVDYLDEKTFASLAAARARAGRDIVRNTYRLHYTNDPAGQFQGYEDSADPARAWGVSEWSHRAGHAAYFDWAIANAIVPEDAASATPVQNPENLDRIDRASTAAEVAAIAANLHEIQLALDEANAGRNPLGFDADSIAFDLNPAFIEVGAGIEGETHFEQIFARAVAAGANASSVLDYAANANNKIRREALDTSELIVEALRQDIDYRNQLIEIFGRPYSGTIGFGKAYPEGYEGPDTLLFSFLDRTKVDQIVPRGRTASDSANHEETNADGNKTTLPIAHFDLIYKRTKAAMDNADLKALYNNVHGGTDGPTRLVQAFETLVAETSYYEDFEGILNLPIRRTDAYAFQAEQDWGQRTSYGRIQTILEEMLLEEIALRQDLADYVGYIQDWEVKARRLLSELELLEDREDLRGSIKTIQGAMGSAIVAAQAVSDFSEAGAELASDLGISVRVAFPLVLGFSNDATSAARSASNFTGSFAKFTLKSIAAGSNTVANSLAETRDVLVLARENDIARTEELSALEGLVEELVNLSGGDGPKRHNLGIRLQALELKRQEFFTAQAEGFRLLREREAFNKVLAASVQTNRYEDMLIRLSRNETMSKYSSVFNHAQRYTWLAAKAYDYETSLDPGHPASASQLYDKIVKTRQLGLWEDGEPKPGEGGLAEILAGMKSNFSVLEPQLGINAFQLARETMSLRHELFRIGPPSETSIPNTSDGRWTDALKARQVADLFAVPEFSRHCRPFADPAHGPQPGIVIRFGSSIEPGKNFFGNALMQGDHAYSSANYATKIATMGVSFVDYAGANLATTPRAYLVPTGTDFIRVSNVAGPVTRAWDVHDTTIPTPVTLNQSQITEPGFIPSLDGIDGNFNQPRRHADFRVHHGTAEELDGLELIDAEYSTRLVGRSVWNSEWLLIIPGAPLGADPAAALTALANNISDIQLFFMTYSHNGQ